MFHTLNSVRGITIENGLVIFLDKPETEYLIRSFRALELFCNKRSSYSFTLLYV